MIYLIGEIILCLLIAAIFGFLIGWFLRGFLCKRTIEKLEESWVAAGKTKKGPAYVANKNPESLEVHKAECRYAKKISEKNREFYDNLKEALDAGYDGCAYCIPKHHTR
jgi:hypothetical protein